MNVAASVAAMVGGLGLFFYGMSLLSTSLRRLTSRRFQRLVQNATADAWRALAVGALIGGVSQNLSVIAFITIGLVSAGFVTLTAALPILIGANLGGMTIAYFATLDIATGMLFVVGVAAFMLTREGLDRWHDPLACVFGAALLFIGLDFIQSAAAPLAAQDWFEGLLLDYLRNPWITLFVATAASFAVQGSLAITILGISFYEEGLLNYENAVMVAYASNIGSSFAMMILSFDLRGAARQIASFCIWFNIVGAAIMLPLFFVEVELGVPLVLWALATITDSPTLQIVLAFFAFNVAAGIVLFVLRGPVGALLARMHPEPEEERRRRPAFLQDVALEDPDTAIVLAEKELVRVLELVGEVFEAARGAPDERRAAVQSAEADVKAVLAAVASYLDDLGERSPDADVFRRLARCHEAHAGLEALVETVAGLAAAPAEPGGSAERLKVHLLESLDTARLFLIGTLADPDPVSMEFLEGIMGDKGDVLARVRQSYLATADADRNRDLSVRLNLLDLTARFERGIWQLRQLAGDLAEVVSPVRGATG